tara:strand:- start:26 stop:697 length:672 start_codon:yes stop_codon:yes gene_type:complete
MNKPYIVVLSALLSAGSFINASAETAVNGNFGAKYSSDYHRRGEVLSAEALQAQVGFNVGLGAVDLFGDFFTNQSTDSSSGDSDEVTVGFGTALFEDNVNAYLGVYNTDVDASDSDLEAFVSVQANVVLQPTVSLYRDTDDDLYTFEAQLSHDLDLEVVELQLAAILGDTESSVTQDHTYFGAKLTANKTLKDNINLYADLALSDSDQRDNETLWGIGVRVKF